MKRVVHKVVLIRKSIGGILCDTVTYNFRQLTMDWPKVTCLRCLKRRGKK